MNLAFAYLYVKTCGVTRSAFKPYRAYLSSILWVKGNSSSLRQMRVGRKLSFYLSWNLRCLPASVPCLMYSRRILVINVPSWADRVHLRYICKAHVCHGIYASVSFVKKKISCQQCHIKERYTDWWRNMKLHIQCWTKIKCENLCFSQMKYGLH